MATAVKKVKEIPTAAAPVIPPSPSAVAPRAFPGANPNRVIGAIENIPPPAGRAGSDEPRGVWKEAMAPLQVGQSRPIGGVSDKALAQSVAKIAKKHFPLRRYKVWVADENGTKVVRLGRLEDKPLEEQSVPEQAFATQPPAPVTPAPAEPVFTPDTIVTDPQTGIQMLYKDYLAKYTPASMGDV